MDRVFLYNSPKRGGSDINRMVNYFEYIEIKTARYNLMISKFKPHHRVSDLLDLKKLMKLHEKFDLRETYNASFYIWHRESVLDLRRKMAVIYIRDHFRLLFVNKGIANCLIANLSLPLEILILISQYLSNRVIAKFLILHYNAGQGQINNGNSRSQCNSSHH